MKADVAEIENRLSAADKQNPAGSQRFEKTPVELVFRFLGEVDDHIAAGDQVKAAVIFVEQQVVMLKRDPFLDFRQHCIAVGVHRTEIFGETGRRDILQLIALIDAFLGFRQHFEVDVAGENLRPIPRRDIRHHDGHRIGFGAGGTAGAPYFQSRVLLHQFRDYLLFQLDKFFRRTEKFGDVDRQIIDEVTK